MLQRSGFFPQNKEVWCGQFGLNCYLVAFEKVGVIFGYECKHAESKRGMKTSQFFGFSVRLPAFAVAGGRDAHGGHSRSQEPPKHGGKASSRIQ